MKHRVRQILFGGTNTGSASWPGEVGLLVLRLAAGLGLSLGHGINKMPPSDGFIAGVGELGFPLPTLFAWCAGLSEFVGGLLVAAGLITRPAAFFAMGTMAVAFFIHHSSDPFSVREPAMLYGSIMLFIFLHGGGRLSVDRLLR